MTAESEPADDATAHIAELWARLIGDAILFNEQVARTLGISAVDLQTFGVVSRHDGPLSPSDIAARTGLPPSTVTRVLDRLTTAGFVARETVATDRRKIAVSARPRKAAEVEQLHAQQVARIAEINASRTAAELATVVAYLEELAPSA